MPWRFNPPPTWPAPPPGWVPPEGWAPDPSWPPAPPGWPFWVEDPTAAASGTGFSAAPSFDVPTTVAPPGGRRGPARGFLVVLVLLLALGLVMVAIATVVTLTRHTQSQELVTETGTGDVRVENACGPISLRQGPAGVVSTRATIRYSWSAPSVSSDAQAGVVAVRVQCPSFGIGSAVSLVVEVPPGGSIEARSSAGSVQAEGLDSDLTLSSSAGSIAGNGLTSRRLSADTSAGSVSLTWAADADPISITATSSAGSVTVRIPDVAGVAYRVDADSSAGSTTVKVRTDQQSAQQITATSSAGSVLVDYR